MTYMELEFPEDADEARVRSGRNMSDVDRWLSVAAGTGLALYGISRRKPSQSSVRKIRPSGPTLSRSRRQVASSRPPNSQARVRRATGS